MKILISLFCILGFWFSVYGQEATDITFQQHQQKMFELGYDTVFYDLEDKHTTKVNGVENLDYFIFYYMKDIDDSKKFSPKGFNFSIFKEVNGNLYLVFSADRYGFKRIKDIENEEVTYSEMIHKCRSIYTKEKIKLLNIRNLKEYERYFENTETIKNLKTGDVYEIYEKTYKLFKF